MPDTLFVSLPPDFVVMLTYDPALNAWIGSYTGHVATTE